jgi:hypothetical protein
MIAAAPIVPEQRRKCGRYLRPIRPAEPHPIQYSEGAGAKSISWSYCVDCRKASWADSSTTRCRGELMQFGHGRRRHPITFGPVLPRPRSWSVRRHQLASAGPRLLPRDTERIDDSDEVGYRLGP